MTLKIRWKAKVRKYSKRDCSQTVRQQKREYMKLSVCERLHSNKTEARTVSVSTVLEEFGFLGGGGLWNRSALLLVYYYLKLFWYRV
jgi:hypothetical protein